MLRGIRGPPAPTSSTSTSSWLSAPPCRPRWHSAHHVATGTPAATWLRSAAPADPAHPVLAPGDRAHKVAAQSEKRGVYLDDGLWADLQKLAAESQKETTS